MERKDIHWTPENDIVENDLDWVADFEKMIDAHRFADAKRFLDRSEIYDKGIRAQYFNDFEKRLAVVQNYLDPKNPNHKPERVLTEAISYQEPTSNFNDIKFWDRPYDVPLGISYNIPDLFTYEAPTYGAEGEYPWL